MSFTEFHASSVVSFYASATTISNGTTLVIASSVVRSSCNDTPLSSIASQRLHPYIFTFIANDHSI